VSEKTVKKSPGVRGGKEGEKEGALSLVNEKIASQERPPVTPPEKTVGKELFREEGEGNPLTTELGGKKRKGGENSISPQSQGLKGQLDTAMTLEEGEMEEKKEGRGTITRIRFFTVKKKREGEEKTMSHSFSQQSRGKTSWSQEKRGKKGKGGEVILLGSPGKKEEGESNEGRGFTCSARH